ncbi:DUF4288 domain-containing protein [Actinomadura macrotermitis]|nr:DUF4288 domain-containing protein [Actinomadura macrotermitis]
MLFEVTSDRQWEPLMFNEETMLIYAASEAGARARAEEAAKEKEVTYPNIDGENVTWRFQRLVDIRETLYEDLSQDVDLYSRSFERLEPYEELFPAAELDGT